MAEDEKNAEQPAEEVQAESSSGKQEAPKEEAKPAEGGQAESSSGKQEAPKEEAKPAEEVQAESSSGNQEAPQEKAKPAEGGSSGKSGGKEEAPGGTSAESKKPKLRKLSLEQVEAELKQCQEKMGGFHSGYAKSLLRRKEILKDTGRQTPPL